MTNVTAPCWETKRTDETREIEKALRDVGFEKVDSYRYNSASIRLRVIDPRFEGLPIDKREAMLDPHLAKLPERTQADIMNLFAFAPSELAQTAKTMRTFLLNTEFEDPSPSML